MSTDDQWTPERLARFDQWRSQQAGERPLAHFISADDEPANLAPIPEGSTPPPLDPFGRGPSSPFYRPRTPQEDDRANHTRS